MALDDLHFTIPGRIPWGTGCCVVAAVGLIGYGLATGDNALVTLSILPILLGVVGYATNPGRIEGSVDADGIDLTRPVLHVPFASMRKAVVPEGTRERGAISFPIRVEHAWGVLKIPEAPGIRSASILDAIEARLTESGSREVDPVLRPYLERHERVFGPDRVFAFRAAPIRAGDIHRPRRRMAIALVMLITGVIWLIVFAPGKDERDRRFVGSGAALAILGVDSVALFWILGRMRPIAQVKGWRNSTLVITPVGLAMIQGDVQGEIGWEAVQNVKFKKRRYLGDYTPSMIHLVVEGTVILVMDLYDRPLAAIHERIVRFWEPERLGLEIDP